MEFKLRELLRKVSSYTKEDMREYGNKIIYVLCPICVTYNEVQLRHIWKNNGFVCTDCHEFMEIYYLEPYCCDEITIDNTLYHIYVN